MKIKVDNKNIVITFLFSQAFFLFKLFSIRLTFFNMHAKVVIHSANIRFFEKVFILFKCKNLCSSSTVVDGRIWIGEIFFICLSLCIYMYIYIYMSIYICIYSSRSLRYSTFIMFLNQGIDKSWFLPDFRSNILS